MYYIGLVVLWYLQLSLLWHISCFICICKISSILPIALLGKLEWCGRVTRVTFLKNKCTHTKYYLWFRNEETTNHIPLDTHIVVTPQTVIIGNDFETRILLIHWLRGQYLLAEELHVPKDGLSRTRVWYYPRQFIWFSADMMWHPHSSR